LLHVVSAALLTFYRVCAKRGNLLMNVAGTVVHDHWKLHRARSGSVAATADDNSRSGADFTLGNGGQRTERQ
jgi:hypothetical protein